MDNGDSLAAHDVNIETSRSAIVDREECDRLRLLGWELDGTGYQPRSASVALLSGIHIHEGFANFLDPAHVERLTTDRPALIEESVKVMLDGYRDAFIKHGIRQAEGEDSDRILAEQCWMLELMFRGWCIIRLDDFLEDYEVMSVERAWRWTLTDGIVLPLRMDAIVRRRDDGLLHIVDFKGTGSGDEQFAGQHEKSRQTILYLTALEEHTDEPVGGMLYEGLVRGSFRKDTAEASPFFGQRIQNTPLCYAYRLEGADGIHQWQTKYTRAAGWHKAQVWHDHTPQEWLNFLQIDKDKDGRTVLPKLFIPGIAVNPPPAFRQSARRQIAHQEQQWYAGLARFNEIRLDHEGDSTELQAHLESWAIQKTGRCKKFGDDHRCPFEKNDLCFLSNVTELLQDEPEFQPRIPHHAPEVIQ